VDKQCILQVHRALRATELKTKTKQESSLQKKCHIWVSIFTKKLVSK
jgi:hypothetical protein